MLMNLIMVAGALTALSFLFEHREREKAERGGFCLGCLPSFLRWHVSRAKWARTIFIELRILLQKCSEFSQKYLSLYFVDPKQSRQNFPATKNSPTSFSFGERLKIGQKVGPEVGFALYLYRRTYF